MPSLSELQQFKASFHDIGGQKADLLARDIPFDDLELPSEKQKIAAQPDDAEAIKPASGAPESAQETDAAAIASETEISSGEEGGDFDFGTLIGTSLGDPPSPPFASDSQDAASADLAEQAAEAESAEEFYVPQELLHNLSEELAATPPDFPDGENPFADDALAEDKPADADISDLDLDDLDGFDFTDEPQAADDAADAEISGSDFGDLDGFDFADEPRVADDAADAEISGSDFGDLDGFDLTDEPLAVDEPTDSGISGLDFGDLGDFDLGGAASEPQDSEDESFSIDDLGDFDLPDDSTDSDASGLDLGDLGSFDVEDDPMAAETSAGFGSDGFNIDDLDFELTGEPLETPLAADGLAGFDSDDLDIEGLGDFELSGKPMATGAPADFESDGIDIDDLVDFDVSDDPMAAETPSDFGSDDFSIEDLGDFDAPGDPMAADVSAGFEGDGFNLDDLGDFAASDEALAADGPDKDTGFENGGLDLDNLDNIEGFGFSDEAVAADGPDKGADFENGGFDLDNLEGFAASDEAVVADGPDKGADFESGGFDLDNLEGFDFSDEAVVADGPPEADGGVGDLDAFDLPTDPVFSDGALEAGGSDFGDDFDLPADAGFSEAGYGDDNSYDEIPSLDDFDLPSLDNVLDKPKAVAAEPADQAPAAKTGFWGKAKPADAPPPKSLDEIKITEEEFRDFQSTLSEYPLNLRIACQEVIVEQDASPEKISKLITRLVQGAPAKEAAALAGDILGRTITIPRGFEKSSGEALEAEKGTFSYMFVNSVLPVMRLVLIIGLLAASVFYLGHRFVYTPLVAERIYRSGYALIPEGNYSRANELFAEAFEIHRNRNWFYRYAEAFIEQRQFAHAENKYEMLLRYFPRDRRGVLDFAALQTIHRHNYERADSLLRRQILDFNPNDIDALLAAGDNALAWAERDPSRFEDARISFARVMELQGWTPPVVERMMRYFIRTDNLREVLHLRDWFDADPRRNMQAATLAELGGYLLDKQFEEVRGVPHEFRDQIRNVPDILREAMRMDPSLPEPFYHLSRFYHSLGRNLEERGALEYAVRAFDGAREESIRRLRYRIDAHRRLADALINDREFVAAEEHLVRAVNLFDDGISRHILTPSPEYGRLFEGLGDLEYFVKVGDMEAALRFYHRAMEHGWAPPEMRFRMGVAYYQLEDWGNALEHMFVASLDLPLNQRVLFALGNAALKRGDYFAAQGYYNRLLTILEGQRSRLPILLPNDRPEYLELAERLMMALNNAGVASEMLAAQTGDLSHRTRALAFYSEAQRAWDARTRDPVTMIRSGSVPLPQLNIRNALNPQPGFEPQIFIRVDRDALETSRWERLAPQIMW